MSMPEEPQTATQPLLVYLVAGLLFIAAVPGVGWMWGQFVETIALCIGIALLVYCAAAYMLAVNARLTALEQRLGERDRTRH
jgi:hypothetical protein